MERNSHSCENRDTKLLSSLIPVAAHRFGYIIHLFEFGVLRATDKELDVQGLPFTRSASIYKWFFVVDSSLMCSVISGIECVWNSGTCIRFVNKLSISGWEWEWKHRKFIHPFVLCSILVFMGFVPELAHWKRIEWQPNEMRVFDKWFCGHLVFKWWPANINRCFKFNFKATTAATHFSSIRWDKSSIIFVLFSHCPLTLSSHERMTSNSVCHRSHCCFCLLVFWYFSHHNFGKWKDTHLN